MKRLLTFAVALLLILAPATVAYAQTENVIVSEDEVVEKNPYFAGGENVHISGTIVGDAYIAGGTVTIDGTIEGDLLVAGGTVRMVGEVTNDVRAAAGQLTIDGTIGGNATLASGNIELSEDTTVGGSIVAAGGTLYIASPIGASAAIGAGQVTILSDIPGDADIAGESIRLGPGANVGGNLSYWSENDADIDDSASVSGEITKHEVETTKMPKLKPETVTGIVAGFAKLDLMAKLIGALATFVVGFLVLKIYPNFTKNAAMTLSKKPWKSLGVGFVTIFLLPIAIVLLFVTVIGIPLALILLAGYFVYMYVSRLFVMYWLGNKTSPDATDIAKLLLGIILFYLISLIPFAGGIIAFFVLIFGFGAMLLTVRASLREGRKKKVI